MLQDQESNSLVSPALLASILVFISTIIAIVYLMEVKEEVSYAFIVSLISLTSFSILSPLLLILQKRNRSYFFTSLLIFSFLLVYINYFAIGKYKETLNIFSLDLNILNIICLSTFLGLNGIILLAKKLKSRKQSIEIISALTTIENTQLTS